MAKRTCSVDGCDKPSRARGRCGTHYAAFRAHGGGLLPKRTALDRLLARVEIRQDGCWIFTGALVRGGYSQIMVGQVHDGTRKMIHGHRLVWSEANGPIPAGYDVHHRCHVRACVNLDHLELLNRGDHMRRHHGKLTAYHLAVIRQRRAAGEPNRAIAEMLGFHTSTVARAARRLVDSLDPS